MAVPAVRFQEAIRFAALMRKGPFQECGAAFQELVKIAGKHGMLGGEARIAHVVLCDPETTPAAEIKSAVAVVVGKDTAIPSELTELVIPPSRCAHTVYQGPYEGLPEAWGAFARTWKTEKGLESRRWTLLGSEAPCYEVYLNNPAEVPPDQLQTELVFPLKLAVSDVLLLERDFPGATPAKLYALWANPETRREFNCSAYEEGEAEFKVGGSAKSMMRGADGKPMCKFEERFVDIVKDRRVAYTVTCSDLEDTVTMQSTNILEFLPSAAGAKISVTEAVTWLDGAHDAESHRKGFEAFFDKHAQLLSR